MSETAKRLKAALFASACPTGARRGKEEVERSLARLRTAARARGYDVALERVDVGPPYAPHAWVDEILEGADAGTFQVLLVEDARDLGASPTDADWLRSKLERLGVWIASIGRRDVLAADVAGAPLAPVAQGER